MDINRECYEEGLRTLQIQYGYRDQEYGLYDQKGI